MTNAFTEEFIDQSIRRMEESNPKDTKMFAGD
jgi:hypothetical protein